MAGIRTALIGDWFRAHPQFGSGPGTARSNLRWLAGLLSSGLGVPISKQTIILPGDSSLGFRADLADERLQSRYDNDPLSAWAACFDGREAAGAFPHLFERLSGLDLVIGFEIPPVIRRVLSARGLRYLSVHIHPLRFLPDLLFGLHSNCTTLQSALAAIAVPRPTVQQRVARLSARLARLEPGQALVPPGTPVLFGQTATDASLIFRGFFSSWQDHREVLAGLLEGYRQVAFVRHPHASWPVSMLEWLRDDLAKTVIAMEGNAYPVIMAGQLLGPVISLSSSVGEEAAAFGHDSHFLLANPIRAFAVPELDNVEQIMVGHGFLTPETWEQLLSVDGARRPAETEAFQLGDDHVRSTLEAWSYAGIAGNRPLPDCTKIIMPSRSCTQVQCDQLLSSLARVPAGMASGRPVMIEAAAKQGTMLRCLPPALDNGACWKWDRESEVLSLPGSNGLSPTEDDGVWFDGGRCQISLKLTPDLEPGTKLVGELHFSFFRGLLEEFPVALLRLNGQPLAGCIHRGSTDPYHVLPFGFIAPPGGKCILSLEVSHANSAAALGLGDDPRLLGCILHNLVITVSEEPRAMGETAVFSLWGFGDVPVELPLTQSWNTHVAA